MARSLDGDVVVFLKVDAGVLLGRVIGSAEELSLQTRIRGARDVLSVAPLAISRTSGVTAASSLAAASSRVAVRIRVEAALRAIPPVVSATSSGRVVCVGAPAAASSVVVAVA
jgi:hypothetical protein